METSNLAEQNLSNPKSLIPVARTLCWGTHEEASRLGVEGQGTRHWAYRWIEEHVKSIGRVEIIVDIGGGGVDAHFPGVMSCYAEKIIVVNKMGGKNNKGNIFQVEYDMEKGLPADFKDNSIDIFISSSAIEHLTSYGQRNLFSEIQRILKHGGCFIGTISYITRLDEDIIKLLQSDPSLNSIGSSVYCAFNAKDCLDDAPNLRLPYPPVYFDLFPGFQGFNEDKLLNNGALICDTVGSYGSVKVKPEIDALKLRWFEMGFFLKNYKIIGIK